LLRIATALLRPLTGEGWWGVLERAEPMFRVSDEIQAGGGQAVAVQGDVSDEDATKRGAAEASARVRPLAGRHAESAPLPHREPERAVVFAENPAVGVDDVAASNQ